jgi:hypothetical protein
MKTAHLLLALAVITITVPEPKDMPLCIAPQTDAPTCLGVYCMEVN